MAASTGPNPSWALAAAVVGSSMIFIDTTAVNVALPVLQRDLHASAAAVQWVVEGYALLLSALILTGGSLGDLFGRRRIYATGLAIFTLASIGCALAPNLTVLVAARCLQGVGGAFATPGSLALISASYAGSARGRAIGTWSAVSVIVSAGGPVLGGWLTQAYSWRWIFVINVPLAGIVLAVLAFRVAESRAPASDRRIDLAGVSLATAGLGLLVFGLIRLQERGVEALGAGCVAGGVLVLGAFVAVERRVSSPMLDLGIFASRPFCAANVYTFVLYAALGGSLYFVPFDLINVQGFTPAAAGAALLPMTLILFALSRSSGGLVDRFGPRPLLAGGALGAAAGFCIYAAAGVGRPYAVAILPATLLVGFGAAAFVAPLTTLVMGAVPTRSAGAASGINNAVARVASLFAIALLGIAQSVVAGAAIDAQLARAPVSAATRATVAAERNVLVGGAIPAGISDAHDGPIIRAAVRIAYARGFSAVMLMCALLAALAATVALDASLRRPARAPE